MESAKRREEEQMMSDARTWLNDGPPADVRHSRTGATPLHVAAAKGYLEALKYAWLVKPYTCDVFVLRILFYFLFGAHLVCVWNSKCNL